MKRMLMAVVLVGVAGNGWAQAQNPPAAGPLDYKYYVSVGGGVNFGNQSSGTYGGEAGYRLKSQIELFAEAGRLSDVTSGAMKTAAATVTTFLDGLNLGSASSSLKTPANYGAIGARYLFTGRTHYVPYAALTIGGANVDKKTSFSVNGANVTSALPNPPYGVALGKDLAGRSNNFLLTLGGGVRFPFGHLFADVNLRYGRIFTSGTGMNTTRLVAALGYGF
jgi:hypothetical protein